MKQRLRNTRFIGAMLLLSSWIYAKPGPLFKITESGASASADIILCLNGVGALSCQNYPISALSLLISTTVKRSYPAAGIKVLTPSYRATGCTPYSNGSCLFAMNSHTSTPIQLKNTQNTTTLSADTMAIIPVNSGSGSITITNTGTTYAATNVSVTLPSEWTAINQDASACQSILPNNGTCTISFTTSMPYVARGKLQVSGDNISNMPTTALAFTVGGYLVWEVTDASTVQVIDTSDVSLQQQWGNSIMTGAQNPTAGSINTSTISGTSGIGTSAVVSCYNSTNGGASAGTWYLPAICQMGGSDQAYECTPGLANIDTNLVQLGFGSLAGSYWSSTEDSIDPQNTAWLQYFASKGSSNQFAVDKPTPRNVRCAKSLAY